MRMARASELSDLDIERTMLAMPFEKFERKGFFRRVKDLAIVRFSQPLWRRLTEDDRKSVVTTAQIQIDNYYPRIDSRS